MPLWASWLRDFDILNLFYDEFKSEKMAKFETLIVPRGLSLDFHVFSCEEAALEVQSQVCVSVCLIVPKTEYYQG